MANTRAAACPTERRPSFGSMSCASRALAPSDSYLLGPKRPRPHKIWKKKHIKVRGACAHVHMQVCVRALKKGGELMRRRLRACRRQTCSSKVDE